MKNNQSGKTMTSFVVAFAVVVLSVMQPAMASTPDTLKKVADVQYAGVSKKLMHFVVRYANEDEKPFILCVTGQEGELLFQQKFSQKNFTKTIAIDKSGQTAGEVSFIIKAGKQEYKETFSFKTEAPQVYEEVFISRL
ncbi:hypothetical protein [Aridibaculum aurantiacum]|uniref:hypothetical protein n=1 Tax=Aridibaculum aurantiacum TaxID=2810307 RepID=UPI001A972D31|nr:hypothetical protein [Aridibaculum aurantiacum]